MSAVALGAVAIREALARSGVAADQVDYVVMGQVIRAGTGQITARQAAIAAGVPKEVPALNVDKVCLSGTTSSLADQMIRRGRRRRGRRRHGVDDPGALRAAERPGGFTPGSTESTTR